MKPDPEYLEMIPCGFTEDYIMRSEQIYWGIKAIGAIACIVFVGVMLLWGTP